MKNLLLIVGIVFLTSCGTEEKESTQAETSSEERAIGFNTMLPDLKFHLGTESAVKVVKDLDKLWAADDFDGMKSFFADTAVFYFPDGTVVNSSDEFIALLKEENKEADHSWTFDYAYSVDLDPSRGGEHVQAGFSGTMVKEGVESKDKVHESYYIVDGKIVMWTQYKMKVKDKE